MPPEPSEGKGAAILRLIARDQGAALPELIQATGWLRHSVRGFTSTTSKKRIIKSTKSEAGERTYTICGCGLIWIQVPTMPAHNPYVAWMYEKYGQLDPALKTIIDCFEQMASALKHQAYVLSLVIKDKLERHAQEPASLGQPITRFTDASVELVRTEVLCQLIRSTRRPFEQVVKDGDKATFIAEALEYHILGKVVTDDGPAAAQHSPSSAKSKQSSSDRIGFSFSRAAGYSSVLGSDDQLLCAFGAQVEAIASDVVRQVLYGEVPPVRRTEDFLPDPAPASPSKAAESQLAADPSQLAPLEEAPDGNAATTSHGVCRNCGDRVESGEEVCESVRDPLIPPRPR